MSHRCAEAIRLWRERLDPIQSNRQPYRPQDRENRMYLESWYFQTSVGVARHRRCGLADGEVAFLSRVHFSRSLIFGRSSSRACKEMILRLLIESCTDDVPGLRGQMVALSEVSPKSDCQLHH